MLTKGAGGNTYNGSSSSMSVTTDAGIVVEYRNADVPSPNSTSSSGGQIPSVLLAPRVAAPAPDVADVVATSGGTDDFAVFVESVLDFASSMFTRVLATNTAIPRAGGAAPADRLHPLLAAELRNHPVLAELMPAVLAHAGPLVASMGARASQWLPKLVELVGVVDDLAGAPAHPLSDHRMAEIETSHPYAPATVQTWDVEFPPHVQWMVVTLDKRCATVQASDSLCFFADRDLTRPLGAPLYGQPSDGDGSDDGTWPAGELVFPGNRMTVTFATASAGRDEADLSRFGVRMWVSGQCLPSPSSHALEMLESELVTLAALCFGQAVAPISVVVSEDDSTPAAVAIKSGWLPIPGVTLDDATTHGSVKVEDMLAKSTGTGLVVLPYSISSGRIAYEVKVVKETASQCVCFGCCKAGQTNTGYQADGNYMLRAFNGQLYRSGSSDRTMFKIFQGDTVRVELDMDTTTLSIAKNDEEQQMMFDDLPADEYNLAIQFYSGDRHVELIGMECAGAVTGDLAAVVKPLVAAKQLAVTATSPADDAAAATPEHVSRLLQEPLFQGGLDDNKGLHGLVGGLVASSPGSTALRLATWLERVYEARDETLAAAVAGVGEEDFNRFVAEADAAAESASSLEKTLETINTVAPVVADVERWSGRNPRHYVVMQKLTRSSSHGPCISDLFGDSSDSDSSDSDSDSGSSDTGAGQEETKGSDVPAKDDSEAAAAAKDDSVAGAAMPVTPIVERTVQLATIRLPQLSAAQRDTVRALFAAVVHHHDLVDDAEAAASFLLLHRDAGLSPHAGRRNDGSPAETHASLFASRAEVFDRAAVPKCLQLLVDVYRAVVLRTARRVTALCRAAAAAVDTTDETKATEAAVAEAVLARVGAGVPSCGGFSADDRVWAPDGDGEPPKKKGARVKGSKKRLQDERAMAFAEAMHNVAHLLPMSPASDLTAEANSGVVRGDGTVLVTGAPVAAAPNTVSYCEVRRRSWTASLWHGVAHGCGRGVLCIVEPGARGAAPTTIVTAHRRHSLRPP